MLLAGHLLCSPADVGSCLGQGECEMQAKSTTHPLPPHLQKDLTPKLSMHLSFIPRKCLIITVRRKKGNIVKYDEEVVNDFIQQELLH